MVTEMNNADKNENRQDLHPYGKPGKMELIATQRFQDDPQLYKIIDYLNRTLKARHLLFGLTKNEDGMNISIYEVE